MSSNNLYTVFLSFSDHLLGVGQYEVPSAEDAVKKFIQTNESLDGYDRDLLHKSLMSLLHLADNKGIWMFTFDPDMTDIEWPGENAVLGGHIVQTDKIAPSRNEI